MKHLRIKLTLVVTLLFISYTPTFAYDFEVNGIYYNVVSIPNLTCAVTHGNSKYSGQITIPEQVTYNTRTFNVIKIGKEAFEQCSSLTDVIIGSSVTTIDDYAFEGCTGLTSVTIPNSVTTIGRSAFYNCSSLTNVIIGSSVTTIDDYAFNRCSNLETLTIVDGSSDLNLGNNEVRSAGFGKGLFYDCPLKNIYLGRNLTYNTSMPYGFSPFYRKNELTTLTIGNTVTQIGDHAFCECTGLTDVTIPNSVTEIDNAAFRYCSSLEKLTIADGSSNLKLGYSNDYGAEGIFYNCPLKSIYLGRNLTYNTSYGYSPFYRKKELTNLTFGNTITKIGEWAFCGCSSLTDVTIPNSVTTIGRYAFADCFELESIISLATTAPSADENTFSNRTYVNATLYIPVGSLESYKSSTCWKYFLIEEKDDIANVESVKTNKNLVEKARYSLEGKKLLTPEKGINIIKMSDGTTKKIIVK